MTFHQHLFTEEEEQVEKLLTSRVSSFNCLLHQPANSYAQSVAVGQVTYWKLRRFGTICIQLGSHFVLLLLLLLLLMISVILEQRHSWWHRQLLGGVSGRNKWKYINTAESKEKKKTRPTMEGVISLSDTAGNRVSCPNLNQHLINEMFLLVVGIDIVEKCGCGSGGSFTWEKERKIAAPLLVICEFQLVCGVRIVVITGV